MTCKTMNVLLNPSWIKISGIIIGYFLWSALASFEYITQTINAPVCFYQNNGLHICAPETIQITIKGPRKHMYYVNKKYIAFNIDISNYQPGEHEILLNESNLFLPEPLKLIDLEQSIISITIQ